MLSKKTITLGLAFLGLVILILILEFVSLPGDSILWGAISNWGHVPLFGIFSLLVLLVLRKIYSNEKNLFWLYLAAFVITSGVGMISEIAQIAGPRDADLWDIVRDILGAFVFLGIYATYDNNFQVISIVSPYKKLLRIALLVMFLVTFIPILNAAYALHARDKAFPIIAVFENHWEKKFMKTDNARLEFIKAPPDWKNNSTGTGKVEFHPAEFPHLEFVDPVENWLNYGYLEISIFSPYDTMITIHIRIEDAYHNQEYADRYQGTLTLNPGINNIALPLEEVWQGPAYRDLDMTAISSFQIYAYQPKESFILYFDNIRLVP